MNSNRDIVKLFYLLVTFLFTDFFVSIFIYYLNKILSVSNPEILLILGLPISYFLTYKIINNIVFGKSSNLFNDVIQEFNQFKIASVLTGLGFGILLLALNLSVTKILLFISQDFVSQTAKNVTTFQNFNWSFSVLTACLIVPFIEELVFRKGLFNLFTIWSDKTKIFISSFSFALLHTQLNVVNLNNVRFFILAFVSGIFFSLLYKKEKNIWTNFTAHALFNTLVLCL